MFSGDFTNGSLLPTTIGGDPTAAGAESFLEEKVKTHNYYIYIFYEPSHRFLEKKSRLTSTT